MRSLPLSPSFSTPLAPSRPTLLARAVRAALLGLPLLAALPPALPAAQAADNGAAAAATRSYDVPAGPLARSLVQFAGQAGIQLSVDAALTGSLTSPGVRGQHSVAAALAAVLAGSGLEAVNRGGNEYTLRKLPPAKAGEATLPAVTVQATAERGDLPRPYAGGQVARGGRVGLLGARDVMDTPFNQTSYTAELMQNQQTRSVADVVANDPSVRNINPTAGRFDQFSMRGFRISNSDIAFDGLYGMLSTYAVAVEMAERIEVLKGPNAMLNGMSPNGGVGGAINLMPKRAGDAPLTQFTASYASDAQFGGHLDVGRRFGPDNSIGVRFNGAYRDGDIAVDDQSLKLGLGELAIDYRGERLRLSADLGHQERYVDAPLERVQVNAGLEVPKAPDADRNFAQSWTYAYARDSHAVLRGEYDLTPDVTAHAAIGRSAGRYDFLRQIFTRVTNAQGDFTYTPDYYLRDEDVWSSEAGLRARFDTGPVRHAFSVGLTRFQLEVRDTAGQRFSGAPFTSNLYNPVSLAKQAQTIGDGDLAKTGETELTSLALADTLSVLDDRVQLTLGARRQRVQVKSFSAATGATTADYDEQATTPAVGLVVKLRPNVSLYANYIEALTRGPTAPSTAQNRGEVFAPFESKQVEVGAKVDFGSLTTTLSVFRIEQPSALTNAATNVFGLDGEQRNRGIEWNVFGEPVAGVRLLGGVMWIDGELVKTAGGANDGNSAVGVSKINLNLGGEWDPALLPGLTLTARAIHTGSAYLDAANTQKVASWTRYDLGARYALQAGSTPLTLRATVENLLDRNYWTATDFGLVLGAPRTVLLSATVDF